MPSDNRSFFESLRQRIGGGGSDSGQTLAMIGEAWAQEARNKCPIGGHWNEDEGQHEGGALRDSIHWIQDSPSRGHLEMLRYGQIVVSGHGEYTIESRGKPLRFYWPRVAQVVYAKSVHIPNQPSNDFVARAWESPAVQGLIQSLGLSVRRE